MTEVKRVLIIGGSKGIGKAVFDKLDNSTVYNVIDFSRSSGIDLLSDFISIPVKETDILIYCTGVGFFNEAGRMPENIQKMIRLNLEAPILLTYQIKAKHYIYIGSNSSYYGFAGSETYCAVKHGILGFARALRKCGKKVSMINPGTVNTDFWKDSGRHRPDLYLDPEDVASAVIACIENNGAIEEVLITPFQEA